MPHSHRTHRGADREQPLNVAIGKRGADEMYRRRDRTEAKRDAIAQQPPDPLAEWLKESFPYGFPSHWFQR